VKGRTSLSILQARWLSGNDGLDAGLSKAEMLSKASRTVPVKKSPQASTAFIPRHPFFSSAILLSLSPPLPLSICDISQPRGNRATWNRFLPAVGSVNEHEPSSEEPSSDSWFIVALGEHVSVLYRRDKFADSAIRSSQAYCPFLSRLRAVECVARDSPKAITAQGESQELALARRFLRRLICRDLATVTAIAAVAAVLTATATPTTASCGHRCRCQ
jgi:hypothetical protein